MPLTGYKITSTGETIAGAGGLWSNPTNIEVFDANAATRALSGGVPESNPLRATNFDFARLDANESIVGISVQLLVGLTVGGDNAAGLTRIQLVLAGSTIGNDLISASDDLLAAFTILSYGGPTNLWGATPSITNAQTSTFGVELIATRNSGSSSVNIRYITMAIHVTNRKASWTSIRRAPGRGRSALRSRA